MKQLSFVRHLLWCALLLPVIQLQAAPPALLSAEQEARLEDMLLRQQYQERERARRARESREEASPDAAQAGMTDDVPMMDEGDEPTRGVPGMRPSVPPSAPATRPLPKVLGMILGDPEILAMLPPDIIEQLRSKRLHDDLRAGNPQAHHWLNNLVSAINKALQEMPPAGHPGGGQHGHGPHHGHASHGPQRPPQPQMSPAAQQAMGYIQHPQVQQKLATDPKALKPIIEGVYKALERPDPRTKPRGFWQRLGALRHKLSPSGMTQAFQTKFGQMVIAGWNRFGKIIRRGLVAIIGKHNIYEMDAKGNIKRDPTSGAPLPKMVMRTRNVLDLDHTMGSMQGMMGALTTGMKAMGDVDKGKVPSVTYQERGPNRWYEMLHNKHNLLRAIIEAGMMRVNRTLIHSVERLFIRPLLMNHLHIPEWKLSYSHYLLYMHTKHNESTPESSEPLLSAKGLKEKLLPLIEHPQNFVQHRIPFDLEDIRFKYRRGGAQKVQAEAELEAGIRTFMHKVYQPLIDQIKGTNGQQQHDRLTGISDDRWVHELKEIGLEFADGMRDNQSFTAHAILGIARQANKRLKISDLWGKGTGPLVGDPANTFDDDMKEIERVVSAIHARPAHQNATTNPVQFRGTNLTPVTERKLIWATERFIDMFRDFILPPLQGQIGLLSYPQYMRRLIMPQLAMKFMPEAMKKKLGFVGTDGEKRAAEQFHIVEEFFDATFHGLDAIIDVIALVKEFRNTPTLRGKYYQFGAALNNCLVKISMSLNALGISGDPDLMDHSVKYLLGKIHGKIGSKFTPFEEQRIANALLKAQINDADQIRILKGKGTVDQIITAINEIRHQKEKHHKTLFGDRGETTRKFEELRERWGSKLMGVHSGLTMVISLMSKFGILEILQEVDERKQTLSEVGFEELTKIFARKTVAHIVASGVQTVLGKLFKPISEGITGMGATLMGSHNYHMMTGKFHQNTGGVFTKGFKPVYSFVKHATEGTLKHGVSNIGKALEQAGEKTMRDTGLGAAIDNMKQKFGPLGAMMDGEGDMDPSQMAQMASGFMGGGM